jgi:hypothetical protein
MLLTKCVIRPAGLPPQLGTGALVVRQRIVRIGELIEDDAAPFIAHALGHVAREFHAAIPGVSTSSAPKACIVCRRSRLWFSGMTRIIR